MIGKGLETANEDVIEYLGNYNFISIIVPTWIRKSWKPTKNNYQLQEIIYGKLEGAEIWPEYSFVDGILKYKRRVVIGRECDIREKIIKIGCDSYIRVHVGTQNSYKQLRVLFY